MYTNLNVQFFSRTSKPYLSSIILTRCNKIILWALHYKYQDAFFKINNIFFLQSLRTYRAASQPRTAQESTKNQRSDFCLGLTVYLQSNQRKNDRRNSGFAKGRLILVPVNLVGFPSGGYDGRWVC